jgi:predicted dehydrogenase
VTDTIKVGLVGAGPWAGLFHAPMLADSPDLALDAVWARRRPAADELAGRYATTAVDTFDELLDRCDAVVFSVPPDVQATLAPAAARAGRHLLLEKPLAMSLADAEAVATAADTAGVVTQLMLTYRFTTAVRDFLRAVAGGEVHYVRTAWISGGALDGAPFATPWRQAPGAALLDVGPHTLDLAEAVAGPIAAVRAAEYGGVLAMDTAHDGGAIGQVALSGTTPGARGPLEAEAATSTGRFRLANPTPGEDVPARIAAEFAAAVRGEAHQAIDVHHGVRIQRLLAAAATALGTGEWATVTTEWGSDGKVSS